MGDEVLNGMKNHGLRFFHNKGNLLSLLLDE